MSVRSADLEGFVTVIGLEVHVQLETDTKIFCGCPTGPTERPNRNVCPVCLGLPGSLPVLNKAAVEAAIKIGKALDATIPQETTFHRKNYYYPDLPKNFQITQFDEPICRDGTLEISVDGSRRSIAIERAHLEEDPGSLQHVGGSIDSAEYTLVNYNRAGVPLMEIVTAPDFRSPSEVRAFLSTLEGVLEYLGVFDASRDGSLRVDANISIVDRENVDDAGDIPISALEAANRTEVKNISSHKAAEKALAYEETRQKNAIRRGRAIEMETRHWDDDRGITVSMRTKEAEKDYRYFEEADIPPVRVSHWREEIAIPELPTARRRRFQNEYGLNEETASKLTSSKQLADFFEAIASEFDPELAATWVADNLMGELNYRDMSISDVADRLEEFTRLIELVSTEEITVKNAEEVVLRTMLDDGLDPDAIVSEEGLGSSEGIDIESIIDEVLESNEDAVSDYESGETEALNFLVGQVMQRSNGRADPGEANQLLRSKLDG